VVGRARVRIVSLYQLHRCVYDQVRASAVGSGAAVAPVDTARYDLTDEERRAYQTRDVAALYRIGLHPVLLNGFCRSIGLSREEYRKVLEPLAQPETRTGRWHRR
jgi:hypothetical protein